MDRSSRSSRIADITPRFRTAAVLCVLVSSLHVGPDHRARGADVDDAAGHDIPRYQIRQLSGHTAAIWDLCFTPDGRQLISAGTDQTVRVWDVATGDAAGVFEGHTDLVRCVAVAPDGQTVASGGEDATVRLWNLSGNHSAPAILAHPGPVYSLVFAPNGKSVVTGGRDGIIRVWDTTTHTVIREFPPQEGIVSGLAFSAGGQFLLSREGTPLLDGDWQGKGSKTLRLWNVEQGTVIQNLEGINGPPTAVRYAPADQSWTAASIDDRFVTWSHTGDRLANFQRRGAGVMTACELFPSSEFLLKATGRRLSLIAGREYSLVRTYLGHSKEIHTVAVSPDETIIASAGDDLEIRLWQAPELAKYTELVTMWKFRDNSQETQNELNSFLKSLRQKADWFPELLVVTGSQAPKWQKIPLNRFGAKFDAIRFRSPLKVPADLYWGFINPRAVGGVGIIPYGEEPQRIYQFHTIQQIQFDELVLPDHSSALFHANTEGRIQPGQEYVIWFSFNKEVPVEHNLPVDMYFVLRLSPHGDPKPVDTAEDIAKAIGLATPFQRNLTAFRLPDANAHVTAPAEIEVDNAFPAILQSSNGWGGLPQALDGRALAMEATPTADETVSAELHMHVKKGGVLLLAASWAESLDRNDPRRSKLMTREKLIEQGWISLTTITKRTPDGGAPHYELFRRHVPAGMEFRFYTQKTNRPIPIVPRPAAVDDILAIAPPVTVLPSENAALDMALSPDGRVAAILDVKNRIHLVDVGTGLRTAAFHTTTENPTLTFSPDGRLLAARGTSDTEVVIWDVAERKLNARLSEFKQWAAHFAFSPDGNTLAVVDRQRDADVSEIGLWDLQTQTPLKTITTDDFLETSVALSPNGKYISALGMRVRNGVFDQGQVRMWDLSTSAPMQTWTNDYGHIYAQAFSPDGETLAMAEFSGERPLRVRHRVRLVNCVSGETRGYLDGHLRTILSLRFTPDGQRMITAAKDDTIRVWDVTQQQQVAVRTVGPVVYGNTQAYLTRGQITLSGDGNLFALIAEAPTVFRLDTFINDDRQGERDWRGYYVDTVNALAFTPDAKRLVAAANNSEFPAVIDTSSWTAAGGMSATDDRSPLAVSPDGKYLVSVFRGLRLSDPVTGKVVKTLGRESTPGNHIAFSPDGQLIAADCRDGVVRIWEVSSGALYATAKHKSLQCLAFSNDRQLLATAGGERSRDRIRLWDLSDRKNATGRPLTEIGTLVHGSTVMGLCFSPDGSRLASGSANNRLKVWNTSTHQVLHTLKGRTGLFSPDSRSIATVTYADDSQTIFLWDVADGKLVHELRGGHLAAVNALVFSPDGTRLVSGGRGGQLAVWDVATGRPSWAPLTSK